MAYAIRMTLADKHATVHSYSVCRKKHECPAVQQMPFRIRPGVRKNSLPFVGKRHIMNSNDCVFRMRRDEGAV
jgi:hypothetical protein